jgi:hypothetical protein
MNPTRFLSEDDMFHSRQIHCSHDTVQSPHTDIPPTELSICHIETAIEDEGVNNEVLFFIENRPNF